jgi:hypothetical protein
LDIPRGGCGERVIDHEAQQVDKEKSQHEM